MCNIFHFLNVTNTLVETLKYLVCFHRRQRNHANIHILKENYAYKIT